MKSSVRVGETDKKHHVRFLPTGRIARECGVAVVTVASWIKQGRLAAVRTPGGHFRVPAHEFERFRAQWQFRSGADEPHRIVVVDDDDDVREFILDGLREVDAQATLEAASDGYEGLLKVGACRPHLLVLDIVMPGLDGFEVCRRITRDPVSRDTKILVISGHADEQTGTLAQQAGADAFLGKPFSADALRAEVERLIGGQGWPR
jgi:excisionase family DNA binding protein